MNDIDMEYQRVFGVKKRKTLFREDDDEYLQLRQQIIESREGISNKQLLPFSGIDVPIYEVYCVLENKQKYANQGWRMFYINEKDKQGEQDLIYAVGYYNYRQRKFVIIEGSFCSYSAYRMDMLRDIDGEEIRSSVVVLKYISQVTHTPRQRISFIRPCVFDTPGMAASFIMGKFSLMNQWRDDHGKTLDKYYSSLR